MGGSVAVITGSLEHDTAFGYVTVGGSIRPEGQGEQQTKCVEGRWGYKSHFHTETTVMTTTTVGPLGTSSPTVVRDTNDSAKVDLSCPC